MNIILKISEDYILNPPEYGTVGEYRILWTPAAPETLKQFADSSPKLWLFDQINTTLPT